MVSELPGTKTSAQRPREPYLWLILAIAVALRAAAALFLGDNVVGLPGTADQVSYHTLAVRILQGHGFTFPTNWWPHTPAGEPTAHWSYLYTFYLAAVYRIVGIHPLGARLLQAVLVGLLQPYLAYLLAGQLFSNFQFRRSNLQRWIPLAAAAITAIYVYFVYYAATLMTEPFYITAVLATLVLAIRMCRAKTQRERLRVAVALGLILAVAVLLRQLFLLFIPFLFIWLFTVGRRRDGATARTWLQTAFPFVIITAILIAAILPATIYNARRFDRFVLLNTNAGFALFWANHPIHGTNFRSASEMGNTYWQLIPAELAHLDEAALDQALLRESIRFVIEDPLRYAQLTLSRIPDYFKFWPDPASSTLSNLSRLTSFALFLPFMLYGLIRTISLFRRASRPAGASWTSPLMLVWLFIAVYTVIHLLSWTQIRYRLPVDAILIVFAAVAVVELSARVLPRSEPQSAYAD